MKKFKLKMLTFLLAGMGILYSCSESNLNKDPDLDDNKTEYPPSSNDGSSNIYPSDSTSATDSIK